MDLSANAEDRGEDTPGEGQDAQSDTEKTDNQKLLRLLEEGEKVRFLLLQFQVRQCFQHLCPKYGVLDLLRHNQ